jgi:hypothetical protein
VRRTTFRKEQCIDDPNLTCTRNVVIDAGEKFLGLVVVFLVDLRIATPPCAVTFENSLMQDEFEFYICLVIINIVIPLYLRST